jgi:ethanolamine ammonia-lyase small subunit
MQPSDPSLAATAVSDPWIGLREFTAARIALGRSGGSQRTASVLDFRLSHARARDAVHSRLDVATLVADLAAAGLSSIELATAVSNRHDHLLRPDLGRQLDAAAAAALAARAVEPAYAQPDLVVIVSDGLSAQAAARHAVATVVPLIAILEKSRWMIAPVVICPFARVKTQDEIGAALGARFSLMLIGERPGLGAPDSLGAYFTAKPGPQCTDADRNCVSNIRPEGIPPQRAAEKLAWLLMESARTGLSGVYLKDTQPAALESGGGSELKLLDR